MNQIKTGPFAKILALILLASLLILVFTWYTSEPDIINNMHSENHTTFINLPTPEIAGNVSVEEAISSRRSVRNLQEKPLNVFELSQLLWSAQGITYPERDFRSAPSAGATYPLKLYVIVCKNGVDEQNIETGVYLYVPKENILKLITKEDIRSDIYQFALMQAPLDSAPVIIVMAADMSRTTDRYGERGVRYVHMEAGHSAQNIYLQATAMELGMVVIGAFDDRNVKRSMKMDMDHDPLYIIPIGYPY